MLGNYVWLMAIVLDNDKEHFNHHGKFCWTASPYGNCHHPRIIIIVNVISISHIDLFFTAKIF